jgi:hypothetical protein
MDMRKAAFVFSLLFVTSLVADSIEQRTAELVAMFNKTKNVQKQKKGIEKSIFLQVRSDAVTPASGTFTADDFGIGGFERATQPDFEAEVRVGELPLDGGQDRID